MLRNGRFKGVKMSKKNTKKHFEKRKAREKAVKKKIVESRVLLRKERKLEREREEAYEREFAQKQNMGLTPEQVRAKIEENMKILEAINEEHDVEDYKKSAALLEMKEQLEKVAKLGNTEQPAPVVASEEAAPSQPQENLADQPKNLVE